MVLLCAVSVLRVDCEKHVKRVLRASMRLSANAVHVHPPLRRCIPLEGSFDRNVGDLQCCSKGGSYDW